MNRKLIDNHSEQKLWNCNFIRIKSSKNKISSYYARSLCENFHAGGQSIFLPPVDVYERPKNYKLSLSLSLSLSTKRNLKGFKTEYGGLFSNEFHGIGNLSRQPDNYTMLSSFFVFLSRIYRTLPFAWRQTP